MTRILVAWEYGEDLGHLRRLLPIAAALRQRGHEVSFAFRDATRLAVPREAGFAAWPAPMLRPPPRINPAPINHADVLLNVGFHDPAAIAGTLRAWNSLLEATRAEIVIADYAPGAMMAATLRGIAKATVGSGFALPPAADPLPAMRAWEPQPVETLRDIDNRLREMLRAACGAREAPALHHLFHGTLDLLCTLPELDPFGPRDAEYVGMVRAIGDDATLRWRGAAPVRVLAYLKPRDARFGAIVDALRQPGIEAIVAAPGVGHAKAAALTSGGVTVVNAPVNLAAMLAAATFALSHAGPGFAAAALLAGVPLALLPMQLEQMLVARRLEGMGAARLRSIEAGSEGIEAWLDEAVRDARLRSAAEAFARAHANERDVDAAAIAAARLDAMIS